MVECISWLIVGRCVTGYIRRGRNYQAQGDQEEVDVVIAVGFGCCCSGRQRTERDCYGLSLALETGAAYSECACSDALVTHHPRWEKSRVKLLLEMISIFPLYL